MSSYQGISSKGTFQEIHEYDLFPPTGTQKVGRDSPIVIEFNNPFDTSIVRWFELQAQLYGQNAGIGQYYINKVNINGTDFQPNSTGQNIDIAIDKTNMKKGINIIAFYHTAPFGAGTPLVADAFMRGKMLIQVDKSLINEITAPSGGTTTLGNTLKGVSDKITESTPSFISVVALIAIAIVAIAVIVYKTGVTKKDIPKLKIPKVKLR